MIVLTNIARAWYGNLFLSADKEGVVPHVLQWPLIRILFQGRIGVAIFSLVTGYVCALKPIGQMRAGRPDAALSSVAKSAFRRVPRLVLPTSIATLAIWICCQLGCFTISHRTTSLWVDSSSPQPAESLGEAIWDLTYNEITTWTHGKNVYDGNQWALWPLLKGSCTVYVTLFATVYVRTRYRMMMTFGLFVYYYAAGDCKFPSRYFMQLIYSIKLYKKN